MAWRRARILLLAVFLDFVAGQSDFERDRFYTRVRCHTCEADFSNTPYRIDHPCLVGDRGRYSSFTGDGGYSHREIAMCSRNSRYCKAEVSRQLGLLVSFQRSCAEECSHSCTTKGFGIVRETCVYCCIGDPSCSENPEKRRDNYARPNRTIGNRRTGAWAPSAANAVASRMAGPILAGGFVGGMGDLIMLTFLAAIGSLVCRY